MSGEKLPSEGWQHRARVVELAALFRRGFAVEAALALTDLLPKVVADGGRLDVRGQDELQTVLKNLLASQERHDWLGLADDLEYELVSLFEPAGAERAPGSAA